MDERVNSCFLGALPGVLCVVCFAALGKSMAGCAPKHLKAALRPSDLAYAAVTELRQALPRDCRAVRFGIEK